MDPVFLAVIIAKQVATVGSPVAIVAAWWRCLRGEWPAHQRWRRLTLLSGLIAVSVDAAILYSWATCQAISDQPVVAARIRGLGMALTDYLLLTAILGAIVGVGRGRVLLVVAAVMEFVLWIPLAIL
jgi:hypothetical protein